MPLGIDIIASGVGVVTGLYQKQLEYKHQQRLAELNASVVDLANARTHRFPFVRAFTMVSLTLYLFILPVIFAWYGLPFLVAVQETNGWFWSIFNGNVDFVFKTLPAAYPFLPMQEFLGSMVFTFYFGRG